MGANVVINFPPFSKSGCAFLFLGVLATLKKENLLVLVLLYLICVIVTFLIFFLGPTTKITESCIEKNYDNKYVWKQRSVKILDLCSIFDNKIKFVTSLLFLLEVIIQHYLIAVRLVF